MPAGWRRRERRSPEAASAARTLRACSTGSSSPASTTAHRSGRPAACVLATSAAAPRSRSTCSTSFSAAPGSLTSSRSTAACAPIPNGRRRPASCSESSLPERASASTSPASRRSVSRTTRSRISSSASTIEPWRAISRSRSLGWPERGTAASHDGSDPLAGNGKRQHQRAVRERALGGRERPRASGIGTLRHLGAKPGDRVLRERALRMAVGRDHGPTRIQQQRRSRDRGGDRGDDLVQPAPLDHQPLEPLVDGDSAFEHSVLEVDQRLRRALGDRDERHLVRDLEDRELPLLALVRKRLRHPLVREPRAQAEARQAVIVEQPDEGALPRRGAELAAGSQQQLAAAEPGRRILQLGDVDPANLPLEPRGARGRLEADILQQSLDGEHD